MSETNTQEATRRNGPMSEPSSSPSDTATADALVQAFESALQREATVDDVDIVAIDKAFHATNRARSDLLTALRSAGRGTRQPNVLAAKLARYAEHRAYCATGEGPGRDCTCGVQALIDAADESIGVDVPESRETREPVAWQRKILPWSEYPVGTYARDHTGSQWRKSAANAWQASGGDVFPQPGASALEVRIPSDHPPEPVAAEPTAMTAEPLFPALRAKAERACRSVASSEVRAQLREEVTPELIVWLIHLANGAASPCPDCARLRAENERLESELGDEVHRVEHMICDMNDLDREVASLREENASLRESWVRALNEGERLTAALAAREKDAERAKRHADRMRLDHDVMRMEPSPDDADLIELLDALAVRVRAADEQQAKP